MNKLSFNKYDPLLLSPRRKFSLVYDYGIPMKQPKCDENTDKGQHINDNYSDKWHLLDDENT